MRLCDREGKMHKLAPGDRITFFKADCTMAITANHAKKVMIDRGGGTNSDDKWPLPKLSKDGVMNFSIHLMDLICALIHCDFQKETETKDCLTYIITR